MQAPTSDRETAGLVMFAGLHDSLQHTQDLTAKGR